MTTADVALAVGGFADPARRRDAARLLAEQAGAEDLIIFIHDPEVDRYLPAPGFAKTLQSPRAWRTLIDNALRDGVATGNVRDAKGGAVSACAQVASDRSVVIFLGWSSWRDTSEILAFLPLIAAMYRAEATAGAAVAKASLAREAALQARALAENLEETRADLRRALNIAEEATRGRDEFMATVSHELRTPLTSILGWLQIIQEDADEQSLREAHATIAQSARAQQRLIEDILDFSRIQAGKLQLHVAPIDVRTVMRDALEIIRPAAEAKHLTLQATMSDEPVLVSADPDRLRQVAWNLLMNAVKFTETGTIAVTVRTLRNLAEIVIADTGVGIAPAFLPLIFDRFAQATPAGRRDGGLGLGLSIVRRLVDAHGGTISVTSDGPGKGAQFTVSLPVLI